MAKSKKQDDLEHRVEELTADLQRTRADFENYRKRIELEKTAAREAGQASAILKLLPVVDNIERAIAYAPEDIKDHKWVNGVTGLAKNLEKSLESLHVKRIDATEGAPFDPELHEAVQVDEEATGEEEVIEKELQAGYTYQGRPIRHAMVAVTRR